MDLFLALYNFTETLIKLCSVGGGGLQNGKGGGSEVLPLPKGGGQN